MKQKSIEKKAASTLVGKKESKVGIWVNGETNSMAFPFAIIGSAVALLAGIISSVYLDMNYELNNQFWFILFLIPLFFVFFGGLSGAIVGIGTPRHNTDPMQGWLVSWRRFAHRNNVHHN